jgi:hypothetical protein
MNLRRCALPIAGILAAALTGCGSGIPQNPAFTVTLSGNAQSVLSPVTPDLRFTPDEHMPFLRQPGGAYRLWASGGGSYGTWLFSTPDLYTLGTPTSVFLPAGPGTTAFDADYAGPGSVFPASNGTDLLMIYHAENHLYSGVDYPGTPFYAGIGLARSSDGGVTWQREGEIISGHDPQQPTQSSPGAGAATPTAIESHGYIYVVFHETDLQSNVAGFAVARAPISSDGAPGAWQKYYQGSFSTAGLGGSFTPLNIVLDPTTPHDQRQPQVSFNVYLHEFVMVAVGNGGIYILPSQDLVHWSPGKLVLPAPAPDAQAGADNGPRNWYPTLASPGSSPTDQITSQTGYLYYVNLPANDRSLHYLYRQAFTITSTQ